MKKYRAKIDSPCCEKGKVFPHDFTFARVDGTFWYPADFPEVFEPIEDEPEFKIMSPAVHTHGILSDNLWENKEDFEKDHKGHSGWFWPATQMIETREPVFVNGQFKEMITVYREQPIKVPVRK